MIWCAKCERHYCIYHGVICGCASDQVELVYRYSTSELIQMHKKLKSHIQVSEANKKRP